MTESWAEDYPQPSLKRYRPHLSVWITPKKQKNNGVQEDPLGCSAVFGSIDAAGTLDR
jgi:hypothetical protein